MWYGQDSAWIWRNHFLAFALSFVAITQASAQFLPEDYRHKAAPIQEFNDGYLNVNPHPTADGSGMYITKLSHPANTGGTSDQDIWYSERQNGRWGKPTNRLPGLNTLYNDLVIGVGTNGYLYAIQFRQGHDDHFNTIYAFQKKGDTYRVHHEIKLPPFRFYSEYFGFFVSSDESFIILSMKGDHSFGKEDLYVIRKDKNGDWVGPQHLGARINTSGFEMSPYVSADGKHLFFGSEGHNCYGSSDIFVSVRLDDTWQNWSKPVNLGPNINTTRFEAYFSIDEVNNEAVFVSSRDGNSGYLYSIPFSKSSQALDLSAHRSASGFIQFERLPAMNVTLKLLDENENVVQTVTTDDNGYFNLQAFLPDKNYKLTIEDEDRINLSNADIFLTNDLGEKMLFLSEKELGIFGFQVLSDKKIGEINQLVDLAEKGKIVDKPAVIKGKLAAYGTIEDQIELKVLDENNELVTTVVTDKDGYFSFTTNATDKRYFLSMDKDVTGLVDVYEIYLTNDNPDEDIVVSKTDKHLFEFRMLNVKDELSLEHLNETDTRMPEVVFSKHYRTAADGPLTGYLKMDRLPVINAKLELIDENDNMLAVTMTDATGMFVFDTTLHEGRYTLKLSDEQQSELANSEIYLVRNPGEVVVYLNDKRNGVFAFKKLAKGVPGTLYSLRTDAESGRIVQETNTRLKGKFQYDKLPPAGVYIKLLDEDEHVIQITEIGENGEFEFENYTVDRNYFIAVEDQGLSDVYEIYLTGEKKNVLVNHTNKYVFAFKVLPTQDVVLTNAFMTDGEDASVVHGEVKSRMGDSRVFIESNLENLEDGDYSDLQRALELLRNGCEATIRITRETLEDGQLKLEMVTRKDVEPVLQWIREQGVSDEQIQVRPNSGDQMLIILKPMNRVN